MKILHTIFVCSVVMLFSAAVMQASSPRMVFVEEYTSTYCGSCAAQNPAFVQSMKTLESYVIPVTVHVGCSNGDPMCLHNPSNAQRVGTYVSGTYGIPACWVNGAKVSPITNAQWEAKKYQGKTSPISLVVTMDVSGGKVNLNGIVQSDEALSGNKILFFAVCEEIIYHNAANGESEFHWVVRSFLPGPTQGQGIRVTLDAGEMKFYNQSINIHPEWDMDKIYAVAFIQDFDGAAKEVLQAAKSVDPAEAKPEITTSENRMEFGKVSDEKIMTIEVKNTGLATLDISDIIINDENGVFELVSSNTATVVPYGTYDLEVKFTPKENVFYTGRIRILSNAENATEKSITTTGQGIDVVLKPELILETSHIEFGQVSGETEHTLTIRNEGYGDLEISSLDIEGFDAEAFSVSGPELPTVIEPDGSTDVTVTFSPYDNKSFSASLVIGSNDEPAEISVPLSGTGAGVKTIAVLLVSDEAIEFGKVSTEKTENVMISNTGYAELVITAINIGGDNPETFSVSGEMPVSLMHDETFDFDITFKPPEDGMYAAEVSFISNSENDQVINLTGEGYDVVGVNDEGLLSDGNEFIINATPHPFGDILNIDLHLGGTKDRAVEIMLIDYTGTKARDIAKCILHPGDNKYQLNASGLASGLYFIMVKIDSEIARKPVLLQR